MAESLHVAVVVGPTSGGIGRHVHATIGELVRIGHTVTVVAPSATDQLLSWRSSGTTFVSAPVGATAPLAVMAATRAIRAAAAAADVVHAHGARAGAMAALSRVHPLVVTWHNTRPVRWRRRIGHPLVERLAARGSDLTLAVSADLLDRAARAGAGQCALVAAPAPASPAAATPPGDVRAALGIGLRPLVLATARLEPQKRLDLLVDAAAGWADRPDGPVVAVAGTGSLAAELERRARAVRAPLRLLGARHDVPDLLRAADVAVLPSDWEGYPLAAQEALRAGVPLVATAVGGLPALVGDAALLVPPGEVAALREALERVLGDDAERRRLAAAGPVQAATWPTLAETVNDLVATYRDLIYR